LYPLKLTHPIFVGGKAPYQKTVRVLDLFRITAHVHLYNNTEAAKGSPWHVHVHNMQQPWEDGIIFHQ